MIPIFRSTLLALFLASLATTAVAREWSVDPGDRSPFAASVPGDTLHLKPGTHRGNLVLKADQTLTGEKGTIVTADHGDAITCSGGATISGVTIEAGDRAIAAESGGRITVRDVVIRGTGRRGIDVRNATAVSIANVTLTDTAKTNAVAADLCARDLAAADNRKCGAAIVLQDVTGVALEDVRIDGSGQIGISGTNVRDATFRRVSVSRAGNELHEHGLVFQQLLGDVTFSEVTIDHPASRAMYVDNSSGTSSITFDHCRISDTAVPNGQQGIFLSARGPVHQKLRVRDSVFSNVYSAPIHVQPASEAVVDIDVSGNTFTRSGGAVVVAPAMESHVTVVIRKNVATGNTTTPFVLNVGPATTATLSAVIAENSVGRAGATGSGVTVGGGNGIAVYTSGSGTAQINISGNDIQQVNGPAIYVQASGRSRVNAAITSNSLREPMGSNFGAIAVYPGSAPKDSAVICARIGGSGAFANTIGGAWDPRGAIQVVHRTASTLRLEGLTGTPDAAAIDKLLRGRNRNATTRVVLPPANSGGTITGSSNPCAVPALPTTTK